MNEIRAALLVIDMQNGFLNPSSAHCIPTAAATVPACAEAIAACRERNLPVFFVVRKYRGNGSDVEFSRYPGWRDGGKALSPVCGEALSDELPPEFGRCERDYTIVKPRFSAFFQTELDLVLRRLGVNTVLLAGTTTPNCIRTTCYDALSLDYNTVVLRDCVSSVTEEIQRVNLQDMENAGAKILSGPAFFNGDAALTDEVKKVREQVSEDFCPIE